jgi:disulfide bond formation protein DsbB
MRRRPCPFCRLARTGLLSLVLGAVAGYAADRSDAGADVGMLATFVAALLPWLWWGRRHRLDTRPPE